MPKARELEVIRGSRADLDLAAAQQARVRVQGRIVSRGPGFSGRYPNVVLQVRTGEVLVRVTAGPRSALGRAEPGAGLDLALTLTGMMDLSSGEYYGRRAQLLNLLSEQ